MPDTSQSRTPTSVIRRRSGHFVVAAVLLGHVVASLLSNYPLRPRPPGALAPSTVLVVTYVEATVAGTLLASLFVNRDGESILRPAGVLVGGGLVGVSVPVVYLTVSPWWTGGGPPPYQIALLLTGV
ncbi:MAG: hypothetical protein ABEI99_05805, partial [Halobaculum sp.]